MWLLSTCCLFGAITFQTNYDINYSPDWYVNHDWPKFSEAFHCRNVHFTSNCCKGLNGKLLQTQLEAILILFGEKSWADLQKCQERFLQALHLHKHTLSLIQYLPPSHCLSFSVSRSSTHKATEFSSWCIVVGPSLIFRGQGCDVHPQLLVSQRQTQELRLDNQLRTSVLLLAIGVFNILTHMWMVRWMAWSSIQLQFTDIRGWMLQFHPNITSSICWSSVSSSCLKPQGSACRWIRRKGMVRLEQRNEREGKEKGRREKREGESPNSCSSSLWVTPWWTKGSPPGGRPVQKEPAMWPCTKEEVGPPTVTRIKEDKSLRW